MSDPQGDDLRHILSAIFRRRGKNGEFTRLFADLPLDQQQLLLDQIRLPQAELPILGSRWDAENWFLLTTERLLWRRRAERQELELNDILHAKIDSRRVITDQGKSSIDELIVETTAGQALTLRVESGSPLVGTWNVLLNIATRNQNAQKRRKSN